MKPYMRGNDARFIDAARNLRGTDAVRIERMLAVRSLVKACGWR
jgi:hypothetical protein